MILSRPIALSLVLFPLLSARAQVFECDFGSPRHRVVIEAVILRSPIRLPAQKTAALRAAIRKEALRLSRGILSHDWAETLENDTTEQVGWAYQDEGYFNASVMTELEWVRDQGDWRVFKLVSRVEPGKKYRLIGIRWKGNSAISTGELSQAMAVRGGETFSREKIVRGLEAVRHLYRSRGYSNFTCIPIPYLGETKTGVGFDIDIDEGKQFYFGELHLYGLERVDREILLSAWDQLRGKPYNPQQADEFFRRFFTPLRSGITPRNYTEIEYNNATSSVDYSLLLARNRSPR
jgi:Surface antigen variable number repeat